MTKRATVFGVVFCVSLMIAGVLSGCGNTNASGPSPNATAGDIQVSFVRTDEVNAEDFTGVWEIASYNINDDVFAKLYPDEKTHREALWQLEDMFNVYMIRGLYYDIHSDGTYDVLNGHPNESADKYVATKDEEGTVDFTASDYDAMLIGKDSAYGAIMGENGQFMTVNRLADDSYYSLVFHKCKGSVEDVEPKVISPDMMVKSSVNVVYINSIEAGAVIDLQVDDNGTSDENDDNVSLKLDMNKVTTVWDDNRPVVMLEKYESYPSGIAVKVDRSDKDADGVLTVEGKRPTSQELYLLDDTKA